MIILVLEELKKYKKAIDAGFNFDDYIKKEYITIKKIGEKYIFTNSKTIISEENWKTFLKKIKKR